MTLFCSRPAFYVSVLIHGEFLQRGGFHVFFLYCTYLLHVGHFHVKGQSICILPFFHQQHFVFVGGGNKVIIEDIPLLGPYLEGGAMRQESIVRFAVKNPRPVP